MTTGSNQSRPQSADLQTEVSVRKNSSFFRDNLSTYSANVQELDTYRRIRQSTNEAIRGAQRLLDIGNGGVFDYDTSIPASIVAIDLFLDELSSPHSQPANVVLRTGSALDIPEPDASFDCVLMVMLLHHLIGKTRRDSLNNVTRAIREAWRVLCPGGRLVIIESCVPKWFYVFETVVFPVATAILNRLLSHPATLQYPPPLISASLNELHPRDLDVTVIPKGNWVLQYGMRFPSALSPVRVVRFVCSK